MRYQLLCNFSMEIEQVLMEVQAFRHSLRQPGVEKLSDSLFCWHVDSYYATLHLYSCLHLSVCSSKELCTVQRDTVAFLKACSMYRELPFGVKHFCGSLLLLQHVGYEHLYGKVLQHPVTFFFIFLELLFISFPAPCFPLWLFLPIALFKKLDMEMFVYGYLLQSLATKFQPL